MRSVMLLLVLLIAMPAVAAPDHTLVESKRHYRAGLAHFNLQEYKEAIDEFEAGYRLHPDPAFLYNLGQSNRLLGNDEQALYFYKQYVRNAPDAPNRGEVEARITQLTGVVAAEKSARQKPPDTTVEPSGAHPAPVAAVAVAKVPPKKTPLYKRWWLWTIVGVVAVGAGVGLGVGLSQRSTPQSYPGVTF